MHIEPAVVDGAKIALSYGTATLALGLSAKMVVNSIKTNGGGSSLIARSVVTTVLALCFFEVLPNYPVGISEVHLMFGSTLFLIFGGGAAAIGLALGLLTQSLFFSPIDLPQYGMNVTTLLVPLWGISVIAKKIIPANTTYVDLKYSQVLALSTVYQGGIVGWVAFWAFYGQGFTAENLASVGSFAVAYSIVLLIEPLIDLAVLRFAKTMPRRSNNLFLNTRLHQPA